MHKYYLISGALFGALAVMLGAFAAHKLKEILQQDTLQIFETAVKYQMYHALALLVVGIVYQQFPGKQMVWAGALFITGILLFSGSLYLLCAVKHLHWNALWVGAITPIGGLCFIAGWVMLALGVASRSTVQ